MEKVIMPKHGVVTQAPNQMTDFEAIANKCLKQIKNKLYFQYKALSPVIYRMPVEFVEPGQGLFGTDARKIYADPMDVILRYKQSPDALGRTYLHMMFHCIYLHPFATQKNIDNGVWNVAVDICAEAAVARLDPKRIDRDNDRKRIIDDIKGRIKMFIPALVYKELMENSSHYDFEELIALFHMDDHLWIKPPQSEREKGGSENGCNGEGEGDSDEKGNGNGKGNGEGEEN